MANKVKYIAKLYLDKSVDTWGPDGAGGTCTFIFDESRTVQSKHLTGPEGINVPIAAFLEQYGLDFSKFDVFDDDDYGDTGRRRFSFSRVEDGDGSADEDGTYLADYNLWVETYEATQVETPDFGHEHV